MVGNWVSAAGSVALVLTALVYRIRIEERALNASLGDRYRDFAAGRASAHSISLVAMAHMA